MFDRTPDGLILQRDFGGHRYARLAHVGDRTGLEMIRTLQHKAVELGIDVLMECNIQKLLADDGRIAGAFGYWRQSGRFVLIRAKAIVLATGGATWPATGSTGDGYRMAAALGHTVTKLRPALVPLVVAEVERTKSMQGVSLKNVRLTAFRGAAATIDSALTPAKDLGRGLDTKKRRSSVIESRMGEMLFTHFGIGGPITLLMSLAVVDALAEGPVSVSIDLKPALTVEELRARLQGDFDRRS